MHSNDNLCACTTSLTALVYCYQLVYLHYCRMWWSYGNCAVVVECGGGFAHVVVLLNIYNIFQCGHLFSHSFMLIEACFWLVEAAMWLAVYVYLNPAKLSAVCELLKFSFWIDSNVRLLECRESDPDLWAQTHTHLYSYTGEVLNH